MKNAKKSNRISSELLEAALALTKKKCAVSTRTAPNQSLVHFAVYAHGKQGNHKQRCKAKINQAVIAGVIKSHADVFPLG